MNRRYAPQVTGAVSSQKAGTSRRCAGRSLSSAHGSAEVPMVNGPPGTSASGPGSGASGAGPGGAGASSTAGPRRS